MRRAFALGLLAVLVAAGPARAQETQPELRIDSVDQSDFPNVVLTVTVPTELNSLDLIPENFFVSENGRSVDFEVEQLPASELQIALLIDTSGSMAGSPIRAARDSVMGFVDAMPDDVEMSLLGFGATSRLIVPFTSDQDAILSGLNSLSAGGETALYDGLLQAAASFEGTADGRRTIVILTDGGDTVSNATLDEALVELIGSEARLVIIELESPESDRNVLLRLEAATGGSLVPASDPEALNGIYAEAASDLINQYELMFEANGQGPTDLAVAVRTEEITAHGSVVAHFPIPTPIVETPSTTTTTVPTTTAAPIVTAAVPAEINVPWYATTTGLMVGGASIFAAATLVLLLLLPTRKRAVAAFNSLTGIAGRAQQGRFSELTNKATLFAEDTLKRGKGEGRLRLKLDHAGLRIRDGEFLLVLFAFTLVATVGGLLFLGPLVGAAFGGIVILIAMAILNYLGTRRANKFRMQLPDSLQLISGSLRAGFGLNQAITAVAGEQDAPANEEFARAQLEVHLGREVEDALRSMAVRTQSEDLPWVAEAIQIHREIGGDVADLLDQIAATVRERERVRGQIQVLSAEGKVSGIVLVLLPFVIAFLTWTVAPEYIGELTTTSTGQLMLAGGLGSMIIGIFWIRRIVRLEF
ncbi:MAG: VWA domain-containing protein [bacterium]|nr:VWA domain-containing protein [bacterium]